MYNHYIPGSDGIYRCQQIPGPDRKSEEKAHAADSSTCFSADPQPPFNKPGSRNRQDLGDLLLACIVILLLLDGDEEDMTGILIAVAAYLFLL